jgi:hypothetical protein
MTRILEYGARRAEEASGAFERDPRRLRKP